MALSIAEKKRQLLNAGYNGSTDAQAIIDAYNRTATPADRAADAGVSGGDSGQASAIDRQTQQARDAAARADAQASRAAAAAAAANAQDFQEKVREFNQTHALALETFGLQKEAQAFRESVDAAGVSGMFNGQPTEAAKEFGQTFGLRQGELTGVYNGQPTLAAQRQGAELSGMFNGSPTESAREFNVGEQEKGREFNVNTEKDLTDLASRLSGPADYFNFLKASNMGRSIVGSLQTNQPRPQFGGFTGPAQPLTLQSIMDRVGVGNGTSGFSASAVSGGDVGAKAGSTGPNGMVALPNGMGFIPLPHQINPSVWDSWGKPGQDFIKGAAASAGLDPNWYESQINATRPGTMTAAPAGASSFSSGGDSAF